VIFLLELAINYYGSGTKRFFTSGWNIFDSIVVLIGFLTLIEVQLGPLSILKVFRAFRVFRLFKRIKALNKIIVALLRSIPGVLNAFVIMFILMAIYAIIATEIFRDFGGGYSAAEYTTYTGNYVEGTGNVTISAISTRGYTLGDEYYGTFSRSLFTMFQVLTGESWAEAIARPLVFGFNSPNGGFVVGFFFTSYLLIMQIVLMNVVVAVLLDKFVEPADKEEDSVTPNIAGGGKLAPALSGEDEETTQPKTTTTTTEVQALPLGATAEDIAAIKQQIKGLEDKLSEILKAVQTAGVGNAPATQSL